MRIKYYLTPSQYSKLWKDTGTMLTTDRLNYWAKHWKPKFNLEYIESSKWGVPEEYGVLIGEEKHINWFLLQL